MERPRSRVGPGFNKTTRMAMKVVFLDIDGVLNAHDWCEGSQSTVLRSRCVQAFNRILAACKPHVVISSAWRYACTGTKPAMRLLGFEVMLRSHGVSGIVGKIIGATNRDEDCSHCGKRHGKNARRWNADGCFVCERCERPSTRGHQIAAWLGETAEDVTDFVAIDDEDFGITEAGIPLVQTDGAFGLAYWDAERAIELLGRVDA